jgi:ABC-2 type transport system ATP-binding protein
MSHTIRDIGRKSPALAAAPAIEAAGLTRNYGAKRAVDGLELDVAAGEIYGFLGPNGAGKSTAVRMLCTLLKPSAGRATVAGHDVEREALEVRRKIGVALQDVALDEGQTGRELLVLQARLYGLSSRAARRRLDDVLDLVDIGAAIDRRIKTYSGGMKRRLDLAAALVHFPQILFLDEPTTGLDPHSRTTVWSEVRRLNADLSMTIFLTTQYLEEADALADRVGILRAGQLVAEGPPTQLKRALGDDVVVAEVEGDVAAALERLSSLDVVEDVTWEQGRLTIGTPDGSAALVPIAQVLGDAGVSVRSITLTTPTLDDVFMALTGSDVEGERTPAEAFA